MGPPRPETVWEELPRREAIVNGRGRLTGCLALRPSAGKTANEQGKESSDSKISLKRYLAERPRSRPGQWYPVRSMVITGIGGRLNGFLELLLLSMLGALIDLGLRALLARLRPALAR